MKRILIISIFSLLLMTGFIGTFWGTQIAEAASGLWNSCPRGEVNDPYPGDCRLYIDTNRDSICDRSQSDPQLSSNAVSSSGVLADASIATIFAGGTSSMSSTGQAFIADSGIPSGTGKAAAISNDRSYYFIPILVVLVVLYSLTWTLSARKTMKNLLHRKIWNMVLLVSAAVSAVLGVFLILSIDFNINISLPFNMLFWHVEAGIALSIVALFHIFWHWRYFTKILRIAGKAA